MQQEGKTEGEVDEKDTECLNVLYEDEHLLLIDKPSGLLVHRGWGREDVVLVDLVREHTGHDTVYTIHRLDRATSGVIVFGKTSADARCIKEQFDAHTVAKHYLALVRGVCPQRGLIDYAIRKEPKSEKRVDAITAFRRVAHTLETEPREVSLVEAVPRSGRLHQIRRHLKHINHPLINDSNYGRGALNRAFRANYALERLALHAFRLVLEHPGTGERMSFFAPLAPDLITAYTNMGFEKEIWESLGTEPDDWFTRIPIEEHMD